MADRARHWGGPAAGPCPRRGLLGQPSALHPHHTDQARRALAEGTPACPHCRPETALGMPERVPGGTVEEWLLTCASSSTTGCPGRAPRPRRRGDPRPRPRSRRSPRIPAPRRPGPRRRPPGRSAAH
nr:DUF6233 domain-containing protein [Streptomyces flavotricini]